MIKLIYCNDGSLAAMIAKKNKSGKWDLFGISEIYGMGKADYNKRLFEFDFVEIIPLNSFSGKSYVCLNRNQKWGLIEVKDSQIGHSEWTIIADFIYDDYNSLLTETKIHKNEYDL